MSSVEAGAECLRLADSTGYRFRVQWENIVFNHLAAHFEFVNDVWFLFGVVLDLVQDGPCGPMVALDELLLFTLIVVRGGSPRVRLQ